MTNEELRRSKLDALLADMGHIDAGLAPEECQDDFLLHLLESYKAGMSRRQIIIFFTKWMHCFNTCDVAMDFHYMLGEIGEAAEALEDGTVESFVEELADSVIYCYGMAQMSGLDFDTVIEKKMKFNVERSYLRSPADVTEGQ